MGRAGQGVMQGGRRSASKAFDAMVAFIAPPPVGAAAQQLRAAQTHPTPVPAAPPALACPRQHQRRRQGR
jgi:hypothetical protein